MRLIDLDKIDVFHQEDEDIVFDIIHATPVDAIPMDFITKFMVKHDWYEYDLLVEAWRKENETD